nr:DNA-directed RNA polymerase subunit beta' [Butyrivibrio sp.]
VLYYEKYIVIDPGDTDLKKMQLLSEDEYLEAEERYGGSFTAGMGAEAIKTLLENINLDELAAELRQKMIEKGAKSDKRLLKRIEIVENFRTSTNKCSWMILDVVPVIPPDLRPMVQLDGGRFATSDLNDLYRRVINRNNRLKKLQQLSAPDIIIRNEKRMLQEAVDALFDNSKRKRVVKGASNRPLKSISDLLKGKQGRFRQNLLGKRVDYSGRSVICVGPELKIWQCGVPTKMALELFKPFIMKKLVDKDIVANIKKAKTYVEQENSEVFAILDEVVKEHPVMLNRAPTLHRLGIQAFEPVLVEGKALRLHPLVCHAFNADFDGDQMAIHVPLSVEAQAECRFLMLSSNNLLKPSDGEPVAVPTQDMILGMYYLTIGHNIDLSEDPEIAEKLKDAPVYTTEEEVKAAINESYDQLNAGKISMDEVLTEYSLIKYRVDVDAEKGAERVIICRPKDLFGLYYEDFNTAFLAYENNEITLHQKIRVHKGAYRLKNVPDGQPIIPFDKIPEGEDPDDYEYVSKVVTSTVGRLLYNELIPQDLGFVDRTKPENFLEPEIGFRIAKKQLKQIIERSINIHGGTATADMLDKIKAVGYKYSTLSGLTVSIADMTIPGDKKEIIEEADKKVERIQKDYRRGNVTEDERYKETVKVWEETDELLKTKLLAGLDHYNPIYMMANSGARGSNQQIKQLAGMKGLMADTTGRTIELPIKANFREGFDVLEYFISAHGARKGLSDTALRTADSGYLTRRLVDVSQELIIREKDCWDGVDEKEIPGMWVKAIKNGKEDVESLEERITGRYSCETIYDDNGNMIVKRNHMITPARAKKIMATNKIKEAGDNATVKIRTVLTCRNHAGVCAKCYGRNLATGEPVQVGEAVGIIAAQSIGEPGTQLTMRTFHSGGVAGGDITQGLPRVEEIFEARKPKGLAIISDFAGKVEIRDTKKKREVVVTSSETGETKAYLIPYGSRIKVQDGEEIAAGDELTEGSVNPHDILKIKGVEAVQNYMLREVQKVYRSQGVEINDKHIEIIVRQMLKKTRIEDAGDSEYLPGTLADVLDIDEVNEILAEDGLRPVVANRILLGITKPSLATNSFLSAASFQETTRVLTDAAIKGKIDPLIGLKENVLIGKLIPAGTGMKRYRAVRLDSDYAREVPEMDDEYIEDDEIVVDDSVLSNRNYDDSDDEFITDEDVEDDDIADDDFSAEDIVDDDESEE